jgi:hypothetical protein
MTPENIEQIISAGSMIAIFVITAWVLVRMNS